MAGVSTSRDLVPNLPSNVHLGTTSTFNLWTHALRNQKDGNGQQLLKDSGSINTLLSPEEMLIVNLVPMDAPHPLYSPKYQGLRTEFLLDYIIDGNERIDPNDDRMEQADGITAHTMSGKSVNFKKDNAGKIRVEGVEVEDTKTLDDGSIVYTLSGLLFDQQTRIDEAFQQLLKDEPQCCFGGMEGPLEKIPLPGNIIP